MQACPVEHAADGVPVEYPWERCGGCFTFVVDCKPLQAVVSGDIALSCDVARPTLEQIVSNLARLFDAGWQPPRSWHNPVVWHRREKNVIADFLCNRAMDLGETWVETFDWPFPGRGLSECNLLVHSDGGTRRGKCSPSGWVAELTILDNALWVRRKLAQSGTFFNHPVSAFTAEIWDYTKHYS